MFELEPIIDQLKKFFGRVQLSIVTATLSSAALPYVKACKLVTSITLPVVVVAQWLSAGSSPRVTSSMP